MSAMKENSTRYIKTTAQAMVEHLCKYLAMRIALDLQPSMPKKETAAAAAPSSSSSAGGETNLVKDLTIFISPAPNQLTPLAQNLSLAQVNEKYWKVNKPMEMVYSFQRN